MSQPKKILHIIPRLILGGAEVLVSEYYNKLDPKFYDMYTASVVDGGELQQRFTNQDKLWIGSIKKMGGRWGVLAQLKTYIDFLKPDIIHTHLLSADLAGYLAKRRLGKKVVWISTLHNVEHHTPFLKRALWRLILKKADRVIAVSSAVAEYAMNNFGVQRNQVSLIPNGIDLSRWLAVPTGNMLKEPTVRLAIVARLEKQKGHRDLFLALNELKHIQNNINWTLDIFGVGSGENQLREIAEGWGISERIRWRGAVIDMPAAFEAVDVVIQPSLWEGMSLVVMEAMAAGRVVVASEAAAAGLIRSNKTGYVVSVGDTNAVAQTLKNVFDNHDEAVGLAEAGRAYAKEHFSIEEHIRKLEQVYNQLSS